MVSHNSTIIHIVNLTWLLALSQSSGNTAADQARPFLYFSKVELPALRDQRVKRRGSFLHEQGRVIIITPFFQYPVPGPFNRKSADYWLVYSLWSIAMASILT